MSGTWTFGGNNVFVVTVDGEPFPGGPSRQWNESENALRVTFTGISAGGESLWGVRSGD